ncbi:DgyrCDS14350 [Dimorphilus gyrociliatus]|uniref:DgyrCDS14350 n=1 Tax=Dimorphilus gyrociliatus TaxID=2664684 RepID=A0A7I8WDC2_9ANNE|nr:DgyrCDS14350 [Dimorphilus gyrociliatus]
MDITTGDDEDKHKKKKLIKDKKEKKDKGYKPFEEEHSEEETLVQGADEGRSPVKVKKSSKSFKFPSRDFFKPEKKRDKDKDKDKEKEKDDLSSKEKKKLKRRKRHAHNSDRKKEKESQTPMFGISLITAIERSNNYDGIHLPLIVRNCIDYIEEFGLTCEGIYRISGVKSKVQALREMYNRGETVCLKEYDPHTVASLFKLFLRELPEPLLTKQLNSQFEEASKIKNITAKLEEFEKLMKLLPSPNYLLMSWVIVHLSHVIEYRKENKMSLQNVAIVLSPTVRATHSVLNTLFQNSKHFFHHVSLKRYAAPLKPVGSKWSLELPDNSEALQEELSKQESRLSFLHQRLIICREIELEEELWEVQRVITQLKRKLKQILKLKEITPAEVTNLTPVERHSTKTTPEVNLKSTPNLNMKHDRSLKELTEQPKKATPDAHRKRLSAEEKENAPPDQVENDQQVNSIEKGEAVVVMEEIANANEVERFVEVPNDSISLEDEEGSDSLEAREIKMINERNQEFYESEEEKVEENDVDDDDDDDDDDDLVISTECSSETVVTSSDDEIVEGDDMSASKYEELLVIHQKAVLEEEELIAIRK